MNCEQLLPDQVLESPELLILAVLDTTLWSLQLALIGTLPELVDDFAEKRADPQARAVKHLSSRATDLTKAIERYRNVLRSGRAPPPDPVDRYF